MIRPVNGSGMKRIALLNDLSCFGKCSLSVSMPILSAYGAETVPLPTAVLSTHTADGFGDCVLRDMTEEMTAFAAHWKRLSVRFDGICTGFFASVPQVALARQFLRDFAEEGTLIVVDPVLGDDGALYGCFTEDYVAAVRGLCADAQFITPNRTEAALLTGCAPDTPAEKILPRLDAPNVIITGVHRGDRVGYLARLGGKQVEFFAPCLRKELHGTGDVFTAALCGELLAGREPEQAFLRAAAFCDRCIGKTAARGDAHWYGLAFEDELKERSGL